MPLRRLALLRFARALLRLAIVGVLAAWTLLLLAWLTLHWGILPKAHVWRPEIEARASRALGVPVHIGSLTVSSHSWIPVLHLTEVTLSDAQGRPALILPQVDAALSPRSLLSLDLVFSQLHITQPQLEIRRDAQGRLHVAGLAMDTSAALPEHRAEDWLFRQQEFVIRDGKVRWIDELRQAPPLALEALDLVLRNGLRHHDLRLDATPPKGWGERFSLRGEFTQPLLKSPGDWQQWRGTAYAELPHVDLAQLRHHLNMPFDLREGSGAGRLWLDLESGQWRQLTVDVALDEVEMRLAPHLAPLGLSAVQGRFKAQRQAQQIEASVEGLRFDTLDGGHWPDGRVAISLTQPQFHPRTPGGNWLSEEPVQAGRLEADRLDIALMSRLAGRLPLPQDVRQALLETTPQGRIDGLRLSWEGPADQPQHYRLQAKGRGLSIAAATAPNGVGRPGWRHADLDVDATEQGGQASLSVQNGALVFPGVFEEPEVPLTRFDARLDWTLQRHAGQTGEADIQLRVRDGRFANADAQGHLEAEWRTGPGEGVGKGQRLPGVLHLTGRIDRGQANRVARYLPLGIPASVRHYVAQSVRAGTVRDVDFAVKGDLWEFPFPRQADGDFRIAGKVEGVDFVYVPPEAGQTQSAWPGLSQLSGELVFDRTSMTVKAAKGRLWGLQLREVDARIPSLVQDPTVEVQGKLHGPLQDGLRFVKESPVGGWLHQALDATVVTGDSDLDLSLRLPLGALDRSTVQGRLSLANQDVRIRPDLPLLAQAQGQVRFTEHGMSLEDTRVLVAGGEARVAGGTDADGALRFQARGRASAEGLRQLAELPVVAHFAKVFQGAADYQLDLNIAQGQTDLAVSSTLEGLQIDLPAPLGKSAEQARAFSLRHQPQWDGGRPGSLLELRLSDVLRAALQWQGEQLQRAQYALGNPAVTAWQPQAGRSAQIRMPSVEAEVWQQALAPLLGSASGDASSEMPAALPAVWDLQADTVRAAQRQWTAVAVRLQTPAAGKAWWQADVQADQALGTVAWQFGLGRELASVKARLERLSLPAALPERAAADTAVPSLIPALDIEVKQFEMRGKPLGHLWLEAGQRRGSGPWPLKRLSLEMPGATLQAQGQWQAQAGLGRMALDLGIEVEDGGRWLAHLGMGKAVRDAQGDIKGRLSWPGSPLSFPLESLQGQLRLDLGKGQFLQAEPGAARLLGILSLQSMPRRFLLDFRDVFSQGFSFDKVSADIQVGQGQARTQNLHIRGLQAQVLLDGSTDLQKERLQARMRVVPDVNAGGASLAYATVNPVIGLSTFLAQYMFRKPLREAGTKEFAISGTWSDPQVEPVERAAGDSLPDWLDGPASAASAP